MRRVQMRAGTAPRIARGHWRLDLGGTATGVSRCHAAARSAFATHVGPRNYETFKLSRIHGAFHRTCFPEIKKSTHV